MLSRIDKEGDYGLFAKRFGSLQSVQTFYKYKAHSIRPYSDWHLEALVENTRRDLVYSLLFEGRSPFDRNVDGVDCDGLALQHGRTKGSYKTFIDTSATG